MQRLDSGVVYLRIQQRDGSLLKEATTKYYKQWNTKSELLEVCYRGTHPWLKGAQVVKWGGIAGVKAWSEDPWGPKKDGIA